MLINGIKHIKSSPYHPALNGAAERMVQTLKLALKADHKKGVPLEKSLANFLLHYRITPHVTTGVAPCTLMMNRGLQTHLDLMKPNITANVHSKQAYQKQYSDRKRHLQEFTIDQEVMIRNFREGDKWIRDKILDQLGPVSYLIQRNDCAMWRRHVDHIQDMTVSPELNADPQSSNESTSLAQDTNDFDTSLLSDSAIDDQTESAHLESDSISQATVSDITVPSTSHYPKRVKKPPDRYM